MQNCHTRLIRHYKTECSLIEKAKGAICLMNLNHDDCQSTAGAKRRHSNESQLVEDIPNCKTAKKTPKPRTHKRDPDVLEFKFYNELRIFFLYLFFRLLLTMMFLDSTSCLHQVKRRQLGFLSEASHLQLLIKSLRISISLIISR